jgi:hypothetical protein
MEWVSNDYYKRGERNGQGMLIYIRYMRNFDEGCRSSNDCIGLINCLGLDVGLSRGFGYRRTYLPRYALEYLTVESLG